MGKAVLNNLSFKVIVKELFKNKKTRLMIIGGLLSGLSVAGDIFSTIASMLPDPPKFGEIPEVMTDASIKHIE